MHLICINHNGIQVPHFVKEREIIMGYLVGYDIDEPGELLVEFCELEVPEYGEEGYDEYRSKMSGEIKCTLDQKPHYEEAKEAGMTHWTYYYDYGDNLTISYNLGNVPFVEGYSSYDHGWELSRESAPRRSYDYVFVCGQDGEIEDITLPNWDNKDKVTSNEEAMKFMSSKLSESTNLKGDELKEVEAFALKWGVPFCGEVHNNTFENFKIDNPAWNSSSAYC